MSKISLKIDTKVIINILLEIYLPDDFCTSYFIFGFEI